MLLKSYGCKSARRRLALTVLLVAGLAGHARTQTVIRLRFDRDPRTNNNPFTLERPADSLYIRFSNQEDMGVKYGFNYELKEPVPDGPYEIYRNGRLERKGSISKGRKEGKWIQYYPDDFLVTAYTNGQKNGYTEGFTYAGKRKGRSFFREDKILWGESYDRRGNLSRRIYFVDGRVMQEETYSHGRRTDLARNTLLALPGPDDSTRKTDGWLKLRFTTGSFEVLLKRNKIKIWKLYDSKGILLAEGKTGR